MTGIPRIQHVGPIILQGCALLPDGNECDCRVSCDEADVITVTLDVTPPDGARILCHVSGLGAVEGIVREWTPAGCRSTCRLPVRRYGSR